jgi:cytochrome P450
MLDLFAAGAETTSTTILWCVFFLAKFPEIQKKLQAEIDSIIGQSRPPSLTDKPKYLAFAI